MCYTCRSISGYPNPSETSKPSSYSCPLPRKKEKDSIVCSDRSTLEEEKGAVLSVKVVALGYT